MPLTQEEKDAIEFRLTAKPSELPEIDEDELNEYLDSIAD